MSRSYKKPILRDRARGKSERALYSRIYRNKVKQFISNRMLGMYHNCLNDVINELEEVYNYLHLTISIEPDTVEKGHGTTIYKRDKNRASAKQTPNHFTLS